MGPAPAEEVPRGEKQFLPRIAVIAQLLQSWTERLPGHIPDKILQGVARRLTSLAAAVRACALIGFVRPLKRAKGCWVSRLKNRSEFIEGLLTIRITGCGK